LINKLQVFKIHLNQNCGIRTANRNDASLFTTWQYQLSKITFTETSHGMPQTNCESFTSVTANRTKPTDKSTITRVHHVMVK